MLGWLKKLTGDSNERELKKLQPLAARINALEPEFEALSGVELQAKTAEFKERLAQDTAPLRDHLEEIRAELEVEDDPYHRQRLQDELGQVGKELRERERQVLDELLPEAFAAVREAAKRTIGQRHFDVQLLGGVVLHQGKIAEMKTGEGKTLVATLPVYLNALTGHGVHVITVNDYLAKRDPQWMGPIYHALGISVASIQHEASYLFDPEYESPDLRLANLRPISRREAYLADVTHGTNNEFGFDYLRDNMVSDLSQCVQRELNYAIVDEVDNILVDEARTPLIISGPAAESTDWYYTFARLVPRLRQGEDYTIEEKQRAAALTEAGIAKVEKWLGISNIYDPQYYALTRYLEAALKAQVLYRRDRDYMVKDGEVIIVDEFTGRLMLGRRYSEGLHQAIEAKEGVKIQRETVTLATITFQNYFRIYHKLAGMTGTAATEAEEFSKIYKLEVVVIPTHQPMIREDFTDLVYKTEEAKFRAVVDEIKELHEEGQPMLVGTVSIEKSEHLSEMLRRRGIPHQVLNARYHEREATIVAQAGRQGAVTIATNMAGRGTDIILGGNPADRDPAEWQEEHEKVVEAGGLHIVGTERHEARRIDNQLRGRSGRQGDPGSSRFYVSLEDDIMRRFGGDRVKGFMDWAGLEDDVPIEHGLISRAIENAQVKVEGYNFDIRKHLVDYDDVMNMQRERIYQERRKILSGADLRGNILEMVNRGLSSLVAAHLPGDRPDEWDLEGFLKAVQTIMSPPEDWDEDALAQMRPSDIEAELLEHAAHLYEAREAELGADDMRTLERLVMIRVIDNLWVEHLTAMEEIRQGIGLRAYGQLDPLVAYKREASQMWDTLMSTIQHDIVHTIYHVGLMREAPRPVRGMVANRGGDGQRQSTRANKKLGRNDPCWCGSGKKYKRCHGAAA